MTRCLWICLLGLILSAVFVPVASQAEVVDRIVATVNGDIITLREVEERLNPIIRSSDISDPAKVNDMRRELLDGLIDRILTLQEGARQGLTVSEEELDRAIEEIKRENKVTQEQFEKELTRRSILMKNFREDLSADILRSKLVNREIRSRLVVSASQVDAYYEAHKNEYDVQPKCHVRNILLKLSPDASEALIGKIMDDAERIRTEVAEGLDFVQAVTKYSDDPNARNGGDMGMVSYADMSEQIREALKDLKEGEVSRPIRTPQGILLLQVVEHMDEDADALNKAKADVRDKLTQQLMMDRYNEWVKDLRSKAHIKINF